MKNDVVFEIGCEELPASELQAAANDLLQNIRYNLAKNLIKYGNINLIATPRRLGVYLSNVEEFSLPTKIEKRGPSVSVAYENGNPSKALLGFCKSLNINPSQTVQENNSKGKWIVYKTEKPGQKTILLLPSILKDSLKNITLKKTMRWGNNSYSFLRPVKWILALMDDAVIDLNIFGVNAKNVTYGHRIHCPKKLTLSASSDYFPAMSNSYVIPNFDKRREKIENLVETELKNNKINATLASNLLNEVTALVEWPVAMAIPFPEKFLTLPKMVLISCMQGHQKYFLTHKKNGHIAPLAIAIANLESKNKKMIINGNSRVLKARLSDASFFFDQDNKKTLSNLRGKLDLITFHPMLGTLGDKTERIKILAGELAEIVHLNKEVVLRSAHLSRCDLTTNMVLEFNELQGKIGAKYAARDNELDEVSTAIGEFYRPAGNTEKPPKSPIGLVIAFADRIDTLAGLFSINQPPSGNKDPFGLRRSAIAALRINREKSMRLDLDKWILRAVQLQQVGEETATAKIIKSFVLERQKMMLIEQGIRKDIVLASIAQKQFNSYRNEILANILSSSIRRRSFKNLVSSFKRIDHIIEKSELNQEFLLRNDNINRSLLTHYDKELLNSLKRIDKTTSQIDSRETLKNKLNQLLSLNQPIDTFFKQVLINDPIRNIQINRLCILSQIRELMQQLCAFQKIQIESE